jgi:hypothetical protein
MLAVSHLCPLSVLDFSIITYSNDETAYMGKCDSRPLDSGTEVWLVLVPVNRNLENYHLKSNRFGKLHLSSK